jgi:hypothetical protein
MNIEESRPPALAARFVVEDLNLPFFFDAYVVDLEKRIGHPDAQCVVLFPSHADLQSFLYVPGKCVEGVPHARVLEDALAAYMVRYRDEIEALRRQ